MPKNTQLMAGSSQKGDAGMTQEEKRQWAAEMLRQRQRQLERLPKKEDFDEVTLSRIKAFLGPWPRALEAAGLKEPKKHPVKRKKRRAARGDSSTTKRSEEP